MKYEGKGKILKVFLDANTSHGDGLLYEAIMQKGVELGLASSMASNGIEGHGFCCSHCRTVHTGMNIPSQQPVVLEFIDKEDKILAFIPVVKSMLKIGAITMQDADIIYNCLQ